LNGYIETIGVASVAIAGILLGCLFAVIRKPYWIIGYLFAVALIAFLILGRCFYQLNFIHPFDYLLTGRFRFIALSLATTLGLTSPLKRLPFRTERILVWIAMVPMVIWFSIMPFLAPALLKSHHASLKTLKNTAGVCFQTTNYTCGPAAAVTALARLGLEADEGQLAILSHSSPVIGTLPGCLVRALENEYSDEGLICNYQYFESVEHLKNADVTLAVIKEDFFTDHCVAILQVNDDSLVIADPVSGLEEVSFQKFAKIWRFSGITLKRKLTETKLTASNHRTNITAVDYQKYGRNAATGRDAFDIFASVTGP